MHEWQNPNRSIKPGSVVSKKNLKENLRYQVRVRARLGPCRCGHGDDPSAKAYLRCAEEGGAKGCEWTPWSQPSAFATPTLAAGTEQQPSA